MTILLLGATGVTGRATAAALVAAGERPVLLGRDPGRLAAVAAGLGDLPTRRVDVTGPLDGLLTSDDVLISTVGPFVRLGEPAIAAAVRAGAGYLDSTGEPPFVRRVFEHHGPAAVSTGARLLTAFGYDCVPGNLAAGLALDEAPGATSVRIGYYVSNAGGRPFSRGTVRSVAAIVDAPAFAYRDGALRTEPTGARLAHFTLAGRDRPAVSIGSSEHLALPRRYPALRDVDVYLGWFGGASRLIHRAAGRRSLPGFGRALTFAARFLPEAPSDAAGRRSFALAEARDGRGEVLATALVRGPEPYELTARLLAHAAVRMRIVEPGARGPVDAFGLDGLVAVSRAAGLVRVSYPQ